MTMGVELHLSQGIFATGKPLSVDSIALIAVTVANLPAEPML